MNTWWSSIGCNWRPTFFYEHLVSHTQWVLSTKQVYRFLPPKLSTAINLDQILLVDIVHKHLLTAQLFSVLTNFAGQYHICPGTLYNAVLWRFLCFLHIFLSCIRGYLHRYVDFFDFTGSIYLKWTSVVILTMQVCRQCLLSDKMRVFFNPNVSTLRCQINE